MLRPGRSPRLLEGEDHLDRTVVGCVPDALTQYERKILLCEGAQRYDARENRFLRKRSPRGWSRLACDLRWAALPTKLPIQVIVHHLFMTSKRFGPIRHNYIVIEHLGRRETLQH